MHNNRKSAPALAAPKKALRFRTALRLDYLLLTVSIAFVIGMLVSHRLWSNLGHTFPCAGVFGNLPGSLSSLDLLLWILLLISLVLAVLRKGSHRFLAPGFAVGCTALLITLDQTRLQPWVYQYSIMLAVLACRKPNTSDGKDMDATLAACQLVLISAYFWSGLQKLNWSFGHEVLPQMLAESGFNVPTALARYLPAAGVIAAMCESMIGIGLSILKSRPVAVLLALILHCTILISLISARHNSVVWPWNFGMMAMVLLLFWRCETPLFCGRLLRVHGSTGGELALKAVFVLCGFAPALSFAGLWDQYLSAALYTGASPVGVVEVSERVRDHLPRSAREHVFTASHGQLIVPFYEWAMADLNVPPYPEPRVFRRLALSVCKYADDPETVELIVKERPSLIDGSYHVFRADCSQLVGP